MQQPTNIENKFCKLEFGEEENKNKKKKLRIEQKPIMIS